MSVLSWLRSPADSRNGVETFYLDTANTTQARCCGLNGLQFRICNRTSYLHTQMVLMGETTVVAYPPRLQWSPNLNLRHLIVYCPTPKHWLCVWGSCKWQSPQGASGSDSAIIAQRDTNQHPEPCRSLGWTWVALSANLRVPGKQWQQENLIRFSVPYWNASDGLRMDSRWTPGGSI